MPDAETPPAPPRIAARPLRTRGGHALELREAEPADAAALLHYLRRVGGESSELTFGAEGIALGEDAERAHLASLRATPNAIMLVVTRGRDVVGSLTFLGGAKPRTRHAGEIGVSVVRAYWGEGIGGALIETMFEWAATVGVRKVNLHVRAGNARAIALYRRLGFVVEGRKTRALFVDGEFHDTLLMGRHLDPAANGAGGGG